jgi:hypothetical protein
VSSPSSLVTAVSGAATAWIHERLALPSRAVRVVHCGPDAVYVDDGGVCLGVLSRRAVAVPCGVRTILDELDPCAPEAVVGDGRIVLSGLEVSVTRFVDASVPSVEAVPTLELSTDELPLEALELLAGGDPRAVALLLGLGSGLTPLGDDVLCGWLAARVALGLPIEPVASEVRELAHRTSLFSATLLACAARGEVVPQFADLLRGCVSVDALLAVGHTSGGGLAIGMSLAG